MVGSTRFLCGTRPRFFEPHDARLAGLIIGGLFYFRLRFGVRRGPTATCEFPFPGEYDRLEAL
jgi:hypothetical protein